MTFNLVGFTGMAQSGKDTAAQVLIERFGYKRLSFADGVREALYALNPQIDSIEHGFRVRNYVDSWGWDLVKKNVEIRRLLQRMGTDVGRNLFGDDFWIKRTLASWDRKSQQLACNNCFLNAKDFCSHHYKVEPVVIPDVRFDNEAEAIRSRGGIIIGIERPGISPVNDHESERGISPHLVTHYIQNTGTVEHLHSQVLAVLESVKREGIRMSEPYKGPINIPCSACSAGDLRMEYHTHEWVPQEDRRAVTREEDAQRETDLLRKAQREEGFTRG